MTESQAPVAQARSLRKPTSYQSMDMVRRRNPIFFSKDTMAHFGTKVESPVHSHGLFITSEQINGMDMARKYTVRRALDLLDRRSQRYQPEILSVADGFLAYETLIDAQVALEKYLTILLLSGRPLLRAMSDSVQGHSGFTALTSATGGFTLVCTDTRLIYDVQKARSADEITLLPEQLCRVDFTSEADAKKALLAGTQPATAQWVQNLVNASRGIPVGPVADHPG